MTRSLQFEQVDVFADHPYEGNALAVVVDADGLTTEQMQAFARWTQLSETTFLLKPEAPDAHYRVRILHRCESCPSLGIRPWAAAKCGSRRTTTMSRSRLFRSARRA